jgi:hypothetical protein
MPYDDVELREDIKRVYRHGGAVYILGKGMLRIL